MKAINPATEEVISEYTEHCASAIEHACKSAQDAFVQWRVVPVRDRAKLMKHVAALLRKRRSDLACLMAKEMGKPITAGESEIDKCAGACDYFAENAAGFLASRPMASDAEKSYVRFDPLGVVLAIMPWNFPFWQVLRCAAPTLMAGNAMLLKHAPNVPGCALAIERLFLEAGFLKGVFSTVLISDNSMAEKLVENPAILAVTLTGSERAGSAVAAAAGRRLIKSVMELGGSDPFIVLADADVPTVAKSAAEARCINGGQSCIAAKRFIIEDSIFDAFESAFVAAMSAMKVGDPMDRATQIGPLARLDILEGLQRQVDSSIKSGAKLLCGGTRIAAKGFFYPPTVLTNVLPGMAAFDEETFGPVAAVIRVKNAKCAVDLANQSRYGLGASIWTRDIDQAESLAGDLQAGSVFINGIVKSDSRLPFGGIKNSGWGRELSEFGIHEFVNVKTIWIK